MPAGAPRISVCVCTRNRADALRNTLDALLPRLADSDEVEILVVDNASSDQTSDVIEEARARDGRVRHVFEPYPGVSRARNTALRLARGEIIVCIDDDVQPRDGWLEALTAPIAAGRADAVAGRVVLPARLTAHWLTSFFRVRLAESLADREDHAPLISANMALSSEVAHAVHFDEELGPGQLGMSDDVLYDYHVQTAEFHVVAADDAVVVHEIDERRLNRPALLELARANARSDAYVWRHWLHSDLGWLRARLALALTRWLEARLRTTSSPPITERLYEATYRIEFLRRLRLERRRRPRYPDPATREALRIAGRRLRSGQLQTRRSS